MRMWKQVVAADARQVSPRASLAAMHCWQPFSEVLQAWSAIHTSKSCPVRRYFTTIPTQALCSLACVKVTELLD